MLKGKERSSLRVAVELMKVLTMAYRARMKQREARVRLRREDFRAIDGEIELGLRNLQNHREKGKKLRKTMPSSNGAIQSQIRILRGKAREVHVE